MIFLPDIEKMIDRLIKNSVPVFDGNHAIYTRTGETFFPGVYPLEIIYTDDMPTNVAVIIAKKVPKNE